MRKTWSYMTWTCVRHDHIWHEHQHVLCMFTSYTYLIYVSYTSYTCSSSYSISTWFVFFIMKVHHSITYKIRLLFFTYLNFLTKKVAKRCSHCEPDVPACNFQGNMASCSVKMTRLQCQPEYDWRISFESRETETGTRGANNACARAPPSYLISRVRCWRREWRSNGLIRDCESLPPKLRFDGFAVLAKGDKPESLDSFPFLTFEDEKNIKVYRKYSFLFNLNQFALSRDYKPVFCWFVLPCDCKTGFCVGTKFRAKFWPP